MSELHNSLIGEMIKRGDMGKINRTIVHGFEVILLESSDRAANKVNERYDVVVVTVETSSFHSDSPKWMTYHQATSLAKHIIANMAAMIVMGEVDNYVVSLCCRRMGWA